MTQTLSTRINGNSQSHAPADATNTVAAVVTELHATHPNLTILPGSSETRPYGHDFATASRDRDGLSGPTVALPTTVEEVQAVLKAAFRHSVTIVPRGAGSGLSGGAAASPEQLVLSTENLNRIIEVNSADELAVVEAGVLNSEINRAVEPTGLFYAPDPASWEISAIGGNIATNAGGLRCVKYGVTRESVLAVDVVLADGELVTFGQRTLKGVTGLDVRSLIIGSEGILGIVVRATLRLRPIPVARATVTAWFPNTATGAQGLSSITTTSVRPSIVEFIDEETLKRIDSHSGTSLRSRGGSLILLELDGYGIEEQFHDLAAALRAAGAIVDRESPHSAAQLWELRRSGRGPQREDEWMIGGDFAVPRSRFPEVFEYFHTLSDRYGVKVGALGHAGDGNLHPSISLPIPEGADPNVLPENLLQANLDLIKHILSLGGTITAEHGLGSTKRHLAPLELSERSLALQRAIKTVFDPDLLINPGKAI